MKNKIIVSLIIIICVLFAFLLSYRLNIEKEKVKELEQEIRAFERQVELNNQDLIKMTKEVENARKVRSQSKTVKNDGHLDAIVDNDFAKFLQSNHSM